MMHNGITPGGGTVVGLSFDSATKVRGYVLTKNVFALFDFPGGDVQQAWDVNPSGKVVGYHGQVPSRGFVLEGDLLDSNALTTIDVADASWTRIFAINAPGDVVGSYADAANQAHGFLLRDESSRPKVERITFAPSTVSIGGSYFRHLDRNQSRIHGLLRRPLPPAGKLRRRGGPELAAGDLRRRARSRSAHCLLCFLGVSAVSFLTVLAKT